MPKNKITEAEADLINVLRFFDRPLQPCFIAKGKCRNVYFEVPSSYYPAEQKYKMQYFNEKMNNLTDGTVIQITELKDLDVTVAKTLDPGCHFSQFNRTHMECANKLIKILLTAKREHLLSVCCKIQLAGVNPYMFVYALSVALMNHPDTRHYTIPSPATHCPEFYFPYEVIAQAQRDAFVQGGKIVDGDIEVSIPPTATDVEVENRVAYFREDIGINLHHWHWHLVYPHIDGNLITKKDRRGELFFYMHQQVLARYNAERLCNRLLRTEPFGHLHEPMREPYFPKLLSPYMNYNWASRQKDTLLKDVNRRTAKATILEMEIWRHRIMNAIHLGKYQERLSPEEVAKSPDKKAVVEKEFTEENGIDVLANIVEASDLSPNQSYYGSLHNTGHDMISFCHDPDNRYLESLGPIGDNRTAMRDPMFYRWHTHIDDIFQEYKKQLPSYTTEKLEFKDVKITSIKVNTAGNPKEQELENKLYTYNDEHKINIGEGIVAKRGGCVYVKYTHLQHKEFTYTIEVENTGPERVGMFRIFLAPAKDEKSELFTLKEQRKLFIELDKFTAKLSAKKKNTIERSSTESSVTIRRKELFKDIETILKPTPPTDPKLTPQEKEENAKKQQEQGICGCGWPDYMLIPKGDAAGYPCKLFVIVTDYEQDKVVDTGGTTDVCPKGSPKGAPSYCGLRNQKYPDKRAMGYPFDRPFSSKTIEDDRPITNKELEDKHLFNMKVQDVTITFDEKPKEKELSNEVSKKGK